MRHISLLIIFIFLLSCSPDEKEVIPEGVIKPEKFTAVMIDVQITEGMRAQGVDIIRPENDADGLYDEIFQKHDISEESFETSYDYYLDRPDEMELIYEQVLDSLSKLDAQVKQRFTTERKARLDSIKRAEKKTQNNN